MISLILQNISHNPIGNAIYKHEDYPSVIAFKKKNQ